MARKPKQYDYDECKNGRKINVRRKGKYAELEVARILRDVFGWEGSRRTVQYSGAGQTADIYPGFDGLHIEVKRQQKWLVDAWIEQALRDAEGSSVPLVITRKNRVPWIAIWLRTDREKLFNIVSKHCEFHGGQRLPVEADQFSFFCERKGHIWNAALAPMLKQNQKALVTWRSAQGKLLEGCVLPDLLWLARTRLTRNTRSTSPGL